ncbi:MAG: acyl carrier protein [Oscillospiraceae bacterium]
MEQELMDILTDLRPDVDFETETALIDDHILESFDIVSLVAALNDAFDIEIGAKDLVPENFNSAKVCWPWCSACRTRTDGQNCTPDGGRKVRHAAVSV